MRCVGGERVNGAWEEGGGVEGGEGGADYPVPAPPTGAHHPAQVQANKGW